MIISSCNSIKGEIIVPGDKSISHRAIMLGAISNGITSINNFLFSKDCISTINCFKNMGVNIEICNKKINVYGNGLYSLKKPQVILDVENSGTTGRLLTGILAGQSFNSTITGDHSIRKRPMKRIVTPLSLMGARFYSNTSTNHLPFTIIGKKLSGINYISSIASAQVKSSILLAGLYANSKTTYKEPHLSRNHTELMLKYLGANIDVNNNFITIDPAGSIEAQPINIPGDISSASFFIVLALLLPNSYLTIKNVGINPTRTGIIDVLTKMGANIKIEDVGEYNYEKVANITVQSSNLSGITIEGDIIPRVIDEIPIIAIAATRAAGKTIIKDSEELKVKESNRIRSIVSELSKMGAQIEETFDGMIINGSCNLIGNKVNSYGDHRIAMALSIAAKISSGNTTIDNCSCVNISFPSFYQLLDIISN